MIKQGIIIKGISGFYYVKDGQDIVTCKARGVFRNLGITPLVGDYVKYESSPSGEARIVEILPRKNVLVRPCVANIDMLAIVISASVPEPDWLLADRLIIQCVCASIKPVPVLNKLDECDEKIYRQFDCDYRDFTHLMVSAETGQGLTQLSEVINGHICCFAGQSAVGKTSILNALLPEAEMETGALSKKTERGRHTTRVAQLLPFRDGAILDTPGFSLFDSEYLTQEQLNECYPEFSQAAPCRFSGCTHNSEPSCGVKDLLTCNKMSIERYERYVMISQENEIRRKHRYD